MLYEKAEGPIKTTPLINRLLKLGVTLFRKIRRASSRVSEQRNAKKTARKIERFRSYCKDLPNFVAEPVFVKVGANDGITDDPCSDILLAKTQWRGLLIEPVPYCFDHLKANYRDSKRFSLEQVAVGASAGTATFYYVDRNILNAQPQPYIPPWFDQLGSFDKNHIVKHGIPEPFIIECTVQVCTLSSLIKRNGIREVHLLHIDTEGYDYEVLKTLDFTTQAPVLIFVEHVHVLKDQKEEMVNLLRHQGYSVYDCGRDYFAINEAAHNRLKQNAL